MRKLDTIVIHASDTTKSMNIGVKQIRKWHTDPKSKGGRGWSDVGYHFILRRNGVRELGRPVKIAGAHAYGYNRTSIGICMVGGRSRRKGRECNFTRKQFMSLWVLVDELKALYPTIKKVVGHNDLTDKKPCPTFDAKAMFSN